MARIILIALLLWASWLGYQYSTKIGTANMLLEKQTKEIENADFNSLSQKAGKGYEYKEVTEAGKKYWIKWKVRDTAFTETKQEKLITSIEMDGRIDFVEVFPSSAYKLGLPFKVIIERKDISEKRKELKDRLYSPLSTK